MPPDDSNALIGSLSDGRYRIEEKLGEGAVGAVYRAVDMTTGERVAIKQWHPIALNDEVRGRFMREATALVTLDHPNIVEVVGHGFADGVPYVALEYLQGQTLETLVEGGKPLPPALALDIARQALSAIAYAHSHQVVHRDLKPENMFLARDERGATIVKILDYGLAKFMAQESVLSSASTPLTGLGMVVGTPLYMPPEQAAGSSVDLAADVYSIGCVLFEMLAGKPPFMAETNVELINLHLRAPIPQLADALPGMRVAPELQALIDKALAKRQTERFPNATAMFEALNRLPAAPIAPIEATPPPAPAAPSHAARSAEAEPSGQPAGGGGARIWIALGALAALGLWLAHSCG